MHKLSQTFRTTEFVELVVLAAGALAMWWWFHTVDAFDWLVDFMRAHESWELDEIFSAVILAGICGFIYAARRHSAAREELKRRNEAESNVTWLAQNDTLTKLPNRRFFEDFARRIDDRPTESGDGFVVFAIDLDGFKNLNDLHGHTSGDEMLRTVAQRLEKLFPNELVVRLGGDEFVVVAAAAAVADPEATGRRICETLAEPVQIAGAYTEVGASVGYANYPAQSESLAEAAHCADIAMYVAKRGGRNDVVAYDEDMRDLLVKRTQMELALREAVRTDLIQPNYQPLVNLRNGELVGFEALARWSMSDGTLVSAAEFIPLADATGLITELSEKLLTRACTDALQWPADLKLAFNLSPSQLADPLIGLRIVKILAKVGFPASRLELEITEGALIHDTDTAVKVLEDLHAAGIRIALDDFGTGYSSLSQLSKFQFDRIKIDRSFVSAFEGDSMQRKIVRAIITLGAGLGVSTTAEGIEKESQRTSLRTLGCQHGQGYLFGRAMAANEALSLIEVRGSDKALRSRSG